MGAERYPPILIEAILRGIKVQLRSSKLLSLAGVGTTCEQPVVDESYADDHDDGDGTEIDDADDDHDGNDDGDENVDGDDDDATAISYPRDGPAFFSASFSSCIEHVACPLFSSFAVPIWVIDTY